jgi:hypothetical protein
MNSVKQNGCPENAHIVGVIIFSKLPFLKRYVVMTNLLLEKNIAV